MIYLNNAATSYPKPDTVKKAMADALDSLPSGQFRSAMTVDNADIFKSCREEAARLMGIKESGRIFFSSGSTEGLNALVTGLGIRAEDIITTVTEHNSVLRPLYNLPGIKGEPVLIPCDENGTVHPEVFEKEAKKGRAKAVILNHCSNVTGALQDASAFGEIAGRYGLLFIMDVSQSAGCLEIKADEWGVDALAFTGHKSLMGPQGTGGYYVREGIDLKPLKYGGTGYDSRRIIYGEDFYEYETGTQNSPGIAGLLAGLKWVGSLGITKIEKKERDLTEYLLSRLGEMKDIRLYARDLKERGPVVSFNHKELPPPDLSYILQNSFNIVTRSGLHCAPLIHRYLGSEEKGTVRVSFSYFSEREDIDALLNALREIS